MTTWSTVLTSILQRLALVLLLVFAQQVGIMSLSDTPAAWADDDGGDDGGDGDGDGDGDGGGDDGGGDDGSDDGGGDDGGSDDGDASGDGRDGDAGAIDDRDGRDDHDEARNERLSGRVPALGSVLRKVRRTHPGRVLDVRLKRRGKRKIYELKILGRDNRVRIVRVPLKAGARKERRNIIRNYNFGARRR